MDYILDGTTKRYTGNENCKYDSFLIETSHQLQFGCEFEFYIDLDKYEYKEAIEKIHQDIYQLTNVDILIDTVSLPNADDKNKCIQIKPDISLQDHGIEISVPITSNEGIEHFINTICKIIDQYGYTNEETGFHIHISTIKNDGVNFDFYKYMLLCHKAGLLSSWKSRPGYSQNVMDILLENTKQNTREIKTKKGTIWNLEKIETNHVEIKSVGGDSYHTDAQRIIEEFQEYSDYFNETLQQDTEAHKQMYLEHKQYIEGLSSSTNSLFAVALTESGII